MDPLIIFYLGVIAFGLPFLIYNYIMLRKEEREAKMRK